MKTYKEINEKIKKGTAVVLTAEEMIGEVEKEGLKKAARKVDVVTTGTFGPMCSSGVFLNIGHSKPRIKIQKAWLNDIQAYAGLAAVDLFLGATELPDYDSLNRNHPGDFRYGGGHVIEDLVNGKKVKLVSTGYGTDCYPLKNYETSIRLSDINDAILCNPRNAYQNYNCAVNTSSKTIYTYMGVLKPNMGNANYCSAGQLSPLLNDPLFRTIGIGTRIFLGGGDGYVTWNGTQHNTSVKRGKTGIPQVPAGTLMVTGDLKGMKPQWIRGVSFLGYGVSLAVGIGIPIPVLDEDIALHTAVRDRDIVTQIVDYSHDYPECTGKILGQTDYAALRSGNIRIAERDVSTSSLSSYSKAREIAEELKKWISKGRFLLTEPVETLPVQDTGLKIKK